MPNLTAMERLANREIAKLGLTVAITVQWAGPTTCKLSRRYHHAHAHCYDDDKRFGTICVRQRRPALKNDWRDLIRHEVAHFGPGGKTHGAGFKKALAAQGDKSAKRALVATGHMRCPKHNWMLGREIDRKVTAHGIIVTFTGKCRICGAKR